ncbi:hypothetical protein HDU91_006930 [Kappamyces sp. JEL0680]|nr:hypothetical protein HDU91_006930 [Kappamyces sp. JEL0680]
MTLNGKVIEGLAMKVGEAGEAFFVVEAENPVPSEYATSPIVSAETPSIAFDDTLQNFSLNPQVDETDPTLIDDLANLHIGALGQPVDDETKGSTFEFDGAVREELPRESPSVFPLDLASPVAKHPQQLASSPPWSWQWGGLPERSTSIENELWKRDEREESNVGKLSHKYSVPVMKTQRGFSPEPPGDMTVSEKVDHYLASGIPSQAASPKDSSRRLAMQQDLDDDHVCKELVDVSGFIVASACGPLQEFQKMDAEQADLQFVAHQLDFADICNRPEIVTSPTSIYRINGFYHSWSTAAPIIMSQVLYQKPLSVHGLRQTLKSEVKASTSQGWFSWGRSSGAKKSPAPALRPKASEPILSSPKRFPEDSPRLSSRSLSPVPEARKKQNYAKSLRLTSDQLKTLGLKDGVNTIQFSVVSGFQGKAICSAKIYLWNHDAKIVISDVDGTITKSDVLGHVFTMVGRDWTHVGVANLYTNIAKNGYQFLYLTSRAIGQAEYTREYLAGVAQDKYQLPEGPVLLSPDRLVQAFTREVIQRRPQEFKIQCLKDVKKLFGPDRSPFYAGFGNRITDAMSYRSVDIPSARIFTIDPSGEVKLELLASFKTSYVKLNETVDQVFPPTKVPNPEFGDFSYWKSDFSQIHIDIPDDVVHSVEAIESEEEDGQSHYEDSQNGILDEDSASQELQAQLKAMQNTSF